MATPSTDWVIFWSVIFLRLLLPLLIPKFPLPAILGCFALDAVDQSVFEAFTGFDLTAYQAYDKALDIFYQSIAMLAVYRNWASYPAVQVARFLFYFRLVGVTAFEFTQWRPLLLVFPNTFEFYFIFYEIVRSRWTPERLGTRFFVVAAAAIWVAVKLPQEYWIHVARLDFTDVLKERVLGAGPEMGWPGAIMQRPVAFVLLMAAAAALVAAARATVRRIAPSQAHALTLAADPLPAFIDEARERDKNIAEEWRLFDFHLLEKIVLVGLVTLIFAQILPGVEANAVQVVWGAGVVVTINAFLRLRVARAGRSRESTALSFVLLAATNILLVAIADGLLRRGEGSLHVPTTLFFLLLLTLIVTLYDHWHPVCDARFGECKS